MADEYIKIIGDATGYVASLIKATQATKGLELSQLKAVDSSIKLDHATGAVTTKASGWADANHRIERSVTRLNGQTTKSTTTIRRMSDETKKAGKSMQFLGQTARSALRIFLASRVLMPFLAVLESIVEQFGKLIDVTKNIAEIQTISQANAASTNEWADALRRVSDSFGLDMLDAAEAAYQGLSNQVVQTKEETEKFLQTASVFARVTKSSMADSVNLLSSALNSFRMDITDVDRVAAGFFKTIELGRIRASEIANSYGDVSVYADQLGVSFDELNASLAKITIQGVKPSKAMTQIRGIFIKLLKPTKAMSAELEKLGYSTGEAAIRLNGFEGFLRILRETTKGQNSELAKLINRVRGLSGAMILTRDVEEYASVLAELETAQEAYAKAVQLTLTSIGFRWERFVTQMKNTILRDFLQPFIILTDDVLQKIYPLSQAFQDLGYIYRAAADGAHYLTGEQDALGNALGAMLKGAAPLIGMYETLGRSLHQIAEGIKYIRGLGKGGAEENPLGDVAKLDFKKAQAGAEAYFNQRAASYKEEVAAFRVLQKEKVELLEAGVKAEETRHEVAMDRLDKEMAALKKMISLEKSYNDFLQGVKDTRSENRFKRDLANAKTYYEKQAIYEQRLQAQIQKIPEFIKAGDFKAIADVEQQIVSIGSSLEQLNEDAGQSILNQLQGPLIDQYQAQLDAAYQAAYQNAQNMLTIEDKRITQKKLEIEYEEKQYEYTIKNAKALLKIAEDEENVAASKMNAMISAAGMVKSMDTHSELLAEIITVEKQVTDEKVAQADAAERLLRATQEASGIAPSASAPAAGAAAAPAAAAAAPAGDNYTLNYNEAEGETSDVGFLERAGRMINRLTQESRVAAPIAVAGVRG